MPINSFLYPGKGLTAGYEVANSCRFNDDDSACLNRSNGSSPSSQRIFTFSAWVKRGNLGSNNQTFMCIQDTGDGDPRVRCAFRDDDKLYFAVTASDGSGDFDVRTTRVFRDVGAWYHFVFRIDTTQSTAADRVKMYVNGSQITSFSTTTYGSQNYDMPTDLDEINIGTLDNNSRTNFFDGYLAEVVYCDGQSLAPSSFGEYDEDSPTIWKPKDVSELTFGTNGFYLDFEDSSNLGNDASGGTDFTSNNLAAADQATDTPTNNFATFNPLDGTSTGTAFVLSEGNCKGVTAVDTNGALQSTMAVSSGKWYAEFKIAKVGDNLSGGRTTVGIGSRSNAQVGGNYYGNTTNPVDSYGKYSASAHYYSNNGTTTSYGSSFVDDDIIGVYLDLDNNKLYFSENGTLYSSTGIDITAAASTLNGHYHIGASDASANDNGEYLANYGGCPAFTISSAVSDDNGYGSFEYSPNITGDSEAKKFYALCTKNLAEFG